MTSSLFAGDKKCCSPQGSQGVGEDYDIFFRVGDDLERVGTHRSSLVLTSCVFYNMLKDPVEEISIPQIPPEIFKKLLRFISFGTASIDPQSVLQLLKAARTFQVTSLIDACLSFVETELSPQNVCTIMEQAHIYGEAELQWKTLEYIQRNANQILRSGNIYTLCGRCFHRVINSDLIGIEETTVQEAAMRWSCQHYARQIKAANDTALAA